MFDLTGRVALVTGAGRGVGAGIARALAGQGAAVAVNDLSSARAEAVAGEIAGIGRRAIGLAADVTDPAQVTEMVAATERGLGPVDILVNNAGIPARGMVVRQFRDMTPPDWEPFIRLNLYGFLYCIHAVLEGMCDRGWGRIVTVSSEAGRMGTALGISLYGAAKAAAVGFSRHLAVELGTSGVTVNCVSLGTMDYPAASAADHSSRARRYPTGRLGQPTDAAAAVVFLAADEASWITGQNLPVNGGLYAG